MLDIDAVRAAGWTQGSVLTVDAALEACGLSDGEKYIVVSHPCDVVSPNLERDPFVQLIRLTSLAAVDGNFAYGKNPRCLHVQLTTGAVEIRFSEMVTIDRTVLAEKLPTFTLGESERRVLASWLAARYARPAFADEFNRRLRPAQRGIEKTLRGAGTHISGIYIAVGLDELPAESSYTVVIAVVMKPEDFDVAALFAEVSAAGEEIALLIGSLDGIELASLEVLSEIDFTLADLRVFARWDYDSLSHRDGPDAVFPVSD